MLRAGVLEEEDGIGKERYIHDQPGVILRDIIGACILEFKSPDMKRISSGFGAARMRTWKFAEVIFEYRPT
jgi:hypothetical protein